jgi:hypothetical protein
VKPIPRKTAEGLIKYWALDLSMGIAIARLQGYSFDDRVVDWDRLLSECGLPSHLKVGQPVRVWIASHYVNANAELWANHPNKALRWMLSGKDYGASTRPQATAMNSSKKVAGYKVIRARADKRHD